MSKSPLQLPDFDGLPYVAGAVQTLTWSFKLPVGAVLTGTPAIAVSQAEFGSIAGVTDGAPQSRIANVRLNADNISVSAEFTPGLGGVKYLFEGKCSRSDNGNVLPWFNYLYVVLPE